MRRVEISFELGGRPVSALAQVIPADPHAGFPRPRVIWLLIVDADGVVVGDPHALREELRAHEERAIQRAEL